MVHMHLHAKLLMDVLGQVLRTIDAAMLATRASEAEHQTGETALDVAQNVGIGQLIHALEEGEYLSVILQKADDGFVQSGLVLVRLVSAGVVSASAVEHIAAAIAAGVGRNALAIGEAPHVDHQGTTSVILTEGGRTVLRMGCIRGRRSSAIAIGTRQRLLLLGLELGKFYHTAQYLVQVRVGTAVLVQQLTQVAHGWRDAAEEVALPLEVAAEAIGTQYLEQAEQQTDAQTAVELLFVDLHIEFEMLQINRDKLLAE